MYAVGIKITIFRNASFQRKEVKKYEICFKEYLGVSTGQGT